jgi:hypothetical protein
MTDAQADVPLWVRLSHARARASVAALATTPEVSGQGRHGSNVPITGLPRRSKQLSYSITSSAEACRANGTALRDRRGGTCSDS